MSNSLLDDLEWRGLIAQSTDRKELEQALSKPISLYLGVDPTAPSMHLGNLVVFLVLRCGISLCGIHNHTIHTYTDAVEQISCATR
jgi:tyrosyl-tRNA synthetase